MKIPKIKWNHINRGLVLGLALGAGTAVYVMVQNAMFKSNIPEISARAEEICRSYGGEFRLRKKGDTIITEAFIRMHY